MVTVFMLVLVIVIFQRCIELVIARRNARYMKEAGGYEVAAGHYKWIVSLHVGFFISLIGEVLLRVSTDSIPFYFWPFCVFCLAQILRIWSIRSLGHFWNTRIFVLDGKKPIVRGPYRYIRHPNYLVVFIEVGMLPLTFGAWKTALIFTVANAMIVSVRISAEEQALQKAYKYEAWMKEKGRFFPVRKQRE
ncbi:isoprenylcysteine carboxylmethyltransferase family protein [Brevibacillus laterosporus]|uniref:isoprenylcysteine carboxyl methyltransferase family protein n=1 Tax=Brevibacillus laterosporus TaxID=1465 RepID=UPI00215C7961|nr:isoprenylcysteine carboxylmethyltransferase family protein [Brevibacillus laterosporus]MCR8935844.1 isoprenylcysteine carboxyl methyltransferase [Brevibacillus laterosporus]MCZ0838483.1 isoprenylcysteine carboxylmethyltransferase family protein [Brevibacillus laterosporus]MCZ0844445.1 isoprenylcysteine carboxylmethyltransferase family protein [Brevibacillus laterosporus]